MKRMAVLICAILTYVALTTGALEGQWMQTGGPEGACINGVTADDSYIYLAVRSRGVWRSTDAGVTWRYASNGIPPEYVSSVATCDGVVYANTFNGLYRSIDHGDSWSIVSTATAYARSLVCSGNTMFSDYDGCGPLRSTDAGVTWEYQNESCAITAIRFAGNQVTMSCCDKGILVSEDWGITWVARNNGLMITDTTPVIGLDVGGEYWYTAAGERLYRSGDNGFNWQLIDDTLGLGNGWPVVSTGAVVLAAPFSQVYKSTNNGETWSLYDAGLPAIWIRSFFAQAGNVFAATSGRGVYVASIDGPGWSESNDGLIASSVTSLVESDSGVVAGTRYSGVWRSASGGGSWEAADSGLGESEGSVFADIGVQLLRKGTRLFAGTENGLFFAENNATSWTRIAAPEMNGCVGALTAIGDVMFAGVVMGGLYRSSDDGNTWTPLADPNGQGSGTWAGATQFSLSSYEGRLFVFAEGYLTNPVQVTSVDNGGSWRLIDSTWQFYGVRTAVDYGGKPYAGSWNGVAWLDQSSFTWHPVNDGLGREVRDLCVFGQTLIAATDKGVYVLRNGSQKWSRWSGGMDSLPILKLLVLDSILYAGTEGLGVWMRSMSDIGYQCGDADGSGAADISDAVFLVAYVFGGGPAPDDLRAGDADCGGSIDISDIVYLISYIFGGGPAPCATCE